MNKDRIFRVILALALICSYIESLIPFYFGIPGVKLGLTNIVVVMMLYCIGAKRSVAGFFTADCFSGIYVRQYVQHPLQPCRRDIELSYHVSAEKIYRTARHLYQKSCRGGISHNIGQLFVAALVVENYNILYYASVPYHSRDHYRNYDRHCGTGSHPETETADWFFKQKEEYIMYAYIKGILAEITEDAIIVEKSGHRLWDSRSGTGIWLPSVRRWR